MSLKQKTVSPALPEPRPEAEEARPAGKDQRWLGFALVVTGIVLISLAATDALAGTGDGSDTLRGSESAERLDGYAGDDLINGFAGDDALSGGGGADEIYGGPGRDTLFGGAGDDVASVDSGDRVSPTCETVYPAFRDDDYAMISRNTGSGAKLYDLKTDPEQQKNIAWRNPGVVKRMFEDYVVKEAGGEPPPNYDT